MNGVDLILITAGFCLLGLVYRQLACERRHREAVERHEEMRRSWRVVERIEAYGYRTKLLSVDDLLDDILKEAA